jgi:hypothetical protein
LTGCGDCHWKQALLPRFRKTCTNRGPYRWSLRLTEKVNHDDYQNKLIPWAESMMAEGPIRMLYVIGKECTGFELEALWDDGTFGLRQLARLQPHHGSD